MGNMTDYKNKLLDLDNEIESIQNLLKNSVLEHLEQNSPHKNNKKFMKQSIE